MDKNIIIEAEEENSATESDITKIKNHLFPRNGETPVLLSCPPGGVKIAVKTTVAMSVATSMHEDAVLFIHFSPTFNNSLCSSVNRSLGVFPSEFFILVYEGGTIFSTSCNGH